MKIALGLGILVGSCWLFDGSTAFGVVHTRYATIAPPSYRKSQIFLSSTGDDKPVASSPSPEKPSSTVSKLTDEEKEKVGNLVADDEWSGLTMELSELVRLSIVEDVKQNTREFLGKEDYAFGDLSKEVDKRVKAEVAKLRGKEEYELGDLVKALDATAKELTCKLTGKEEYDTFDLSKEIDRRVKKSVAEFCGEEEYKVGMIVKEVNRRVKGRVHEFTGKSEYSFGDITAEVNRRRGEWVKDYLGEDAYEKYEFGDITRKAVHDFIGKDEYEFGDVTRTFVDKLFGGKKKKGD